MNKVKIKRLIEAAKEKKPVEVNLVATSIINEKIKKLIAETKKEIKVGMKNA